MLVKVRIKGIVVTAIYGTLSDGDYLVTSADFARHLVEDCKAAEYVATPPGAQEAPPAQAEAPRPRKARKEQSK